MKMVRKNSLTAEVERALREAVAEGQFGEVLPGLRVLAKALGVSAPTVAAALKRLADDGLVLAEGERRRMRVNPQAAGRPPDDADRQVLWFVTPEPAPTLSYGAFHTMTQLMEGLSNDGWSVKHRVLGYGHSEKRVTQWDLMFGAERPSAMVAWLGRPPLAEWAVGNGLRTLFLGGSCGRWHVPMLAVRTTAMVEDALERLMSRGHRRICLPLCNRLPNFVSGIRDVFLRAYQSYGFTFVPEFHAPVSVYEGPRVMEDLVARVRKEMKPTAWIFLDWREYVAASCVFRDMDVRVPEDASVVILSRDPAMEWHRPTLAHYEIPQEKLVRTLIEWVLGKDESVVERIRRGLRAPWVPGDSFGDPPVA